VVLCTCHPREGGKLKIGSLSRPTQGKKLDPISKKKKDTSARPLVADSPTYSKCVQGATLNQPRERKSTACPKATLPEWLPRSSKQRLFARKDAFIML
jgi:hypothetical protein